MNGVLAGISKQLRRTGSVQKLFQIRNSRVPIIKVRSWIVYQRALMITCHKPHASWENAPDADTLRGAYDVSMQALVHV